MEVSNIISDVASLVTQVVTIISGNAVLSAFLGVGLIGAGASLFRKIKRSSK